MTNIKVVCPKCGATSIVAYDEKVKCKDCIYAGRFK